MFRAKILCKVFWGLKRILNLQMIVSSLLFCFLELTSMGITKISPENPFGKKAGEGSTDTEAQEI